ncbi:hypothetical protein CWI36_1581p0010, partial [Hamiltosporidium magnivora]
MFKINNCYLTLINMDRKKNVSSEISKNTKIKAANDADEVKKSDSEVQKCKLHPPAISLPSSSYTTITPPPPSQTCTIPEGNRLMALKTIFDSVTADPKEWPRIVFFAVQTRFERMPRNGWTELHSAKKLAQSEMGKEEIIIKARERRSIATCLINTSTLTENTEYIKSRDKFLSKIKEISENEIGKVVVRTRKHTNELVDSKVLDLINRVVGEYAGAHVPESITEAAYIMQAAQICYDDATRKEKPRSAWKENIESKISKLVLSKDLLE